MSSGFYNAEGMEITRAAFFALKAAAITRQVGRYAAIRYALANGSSLALFRLAQQLQALNKFDKLNKV